jgi:hypothetical protein
VMLAEISLRRAAARTTRLGHQEGDALTIEALG